MKQYDIVKLSGGELAILLQSNLLDELSTRVIIPLITSDRVQVVERLHPGMRVGRRQYVVVTDRITAVRSSDIEKVLGTASPIQHEIIRALDMLISGV